MFARCWMMRIITAFRRETAMSGGLSLCARRMIVDPPPPRPVDVRAGAHERSIVVPRRVSVSVTIRNRLGLHARPAMAFVDAASAFVCAVSVKRADQGEIVDGKSIMDMMMLAATSGTALEITCEGDDAEAAAKTLERLVESGFDEE